MPYYKKVVQPGETVRCLGSLHWIIFAPSLLILSAGVLGGVLLWQAQDDTNSDNSAARVALIILDATAVIYALVALFRVIVRDATTEIVVTDRRVLYKRGFIWRRTIEMNVSKIETVDVVQSVVGRMLDYGTVLVRGTGAGLEPLSWVTAPLALRNAIVAE